MEGNKINNYKGNSIRFDNGMKITFIYHSGFVVEMPQVILIFDYYKGEIPDLDGAKDIYIFSSHKHADHFSFDIFALAEKYPEVKYILSYDIGKKYKKKYLTEKKGISEEVYNRITYLRENEVWEDENIKVSTIPSTDIGVAFVAEEKHENITIYHAGDLNWWTWEGETEEEYRAMTEKFQAAVEILRQTLRNANSAEIDAAFVPLDPRQKENYALGFDYFMRNIPVKYVFPMHAFGDYSVIGKLMMDEISKDYRDKIVNLCGGDRKEVKILNPEMRRKVKELLK